MQNGLKVNNASLIKISDEKEDKFYGYFMEDILKLDFRKSEGRNLLKKCKLSSNELKKLISNKMSKKIIPIKKKKKGNTLLKDLLSGKINDTDVLVKYPYKELKMLAKNVNINYKLRKESICNSLIDYVLLFNKISDNITKVICLQSCIRRYLVNIKNIYKGPAYLNRKLSINDNDFYTCESIKTIPNDYFFSYKDNDGFIYSYDIRSFQGLIENNCMNPYTNSEITDRVQNLFSKRMEQIKYSNIIVEEYKDEIELTEEQKFNQKVLDIFQRINSLGHYSHLEWFTNLTSKRLKVWYKEAEDIFNYRAQLIDSDKKKIIPDGKSFKMRVSDVYKIPDYQKKKLQSIVLNEIDRFISLGVTQSDKYTGSLYMLTAFTFVSNEAAIALPWLCQYE